MLALTCTSPDPMDEGRREIVQQLFGRYFPKGMPVMAAWAPGLEVTEREGKFTVRCDVPGVELSGIQVSVTGRTLTISGERKAPAPSDDQWVRGVTHGSFARTFTLPEVIDATSVNATRRDGVLELELSPQGPDRDRQSSSLKGTQSVNALLGSVTLN